MAPVPLDPRSNRTGQHEEDLCGDLAWFCLQCFWRCRSRRRRRMLKWLWGLELARQWSAAPVDYGPPACDWGYYSYYPMPARLTAITARTGSTGGVFLGVGPGTAGAGVTDGAATAIAAGTDYRGGYGGYGRGAYGFRGGVGRGAYGGGVRGYAGGSPQLRWRSPRAALAAADTRWIQWWRPCRRVRWRRPRRWRRWTPVRWAARASDPRSVREQPQSPFASADGPLLFGGSQIPFERKSETPPVTTFGGRQRVLVAPGHSSRSAMRSAASGWAWVRAAAAMAASGVGREARRSGRPAVCRERRGRALRA